MYVIRKTTTYPLLDRVVVSYFKDCICGIESYSSSIEDALHFRTRDEAIECRMYYIRKRKCDKNEIVKVD